MNPHSFFRVSVTSVALRIPVASRLAWSGVHASASPCYCEIKLTNFPLQTAPLPVISPSKPEPSSINVAASFYLDQLALNKLLSTSCFGPVKSCLEITVYTGRHGSCCGFRKGEMLGTFCLPVGQDWVGVKTMQVFNGWVCIGKGRKNSKWPSAELHLTVTTEPDPRYIFQFDGEPELSPQIVQIQGNIKQPIFTCKFTRDRCSRSRNGILDGSTMGVWGAPHGEKDRERKERKGWLVIIHDLSGSSVAAASMITPFVPTTGSNRVSRSNPGAWLILRPGPEGEDSWRPWGRLEAWRERGKSGGMGCRFQVIGEGGMAGVGNGVVLAESVISTQNGGKFLIDIAKFLQEMPVSASPVDSPHSSGDFYFSIGFPVAGGFVMSANIQGENKHSKPEVQLAVRHVTCVEDAAVFMALAAAVDLSMDACLPFSKKLGKNFSESE